MQKITMKFVAVAIAAASLAAVAATGDALAGSSYGYYRGPSHSGSVANPTRIWGAFAAGAAAARSRGWR
jgi:hypothetical protein